MGEHPDRYDYKTAQIPAPLSKELEEEKQRKQNEKKNEVKLIQFFNNLLVYGSNSEHVNVGR